MIRARFNINTKKLAGDIDQLVIRIQQKIAFEILEGVVNMNPVLTGRSRGNWQVSLGVPASGVLDSWPAGAQDVIYRGQATIDSIQVFGPVYISNNVPYILELEKGTSTQAPQGMVQVTLDRVGAQFR